MKPLENSDNEGCDDALDEKCLTEQILDNITKNLKLIQNNDTCQEEEQLIPYEFIEPHYPELQFDENLQSDLPSEAIELMNEYEFKEKINDESLKYIAGSVAYKFKNKYKLGNSSNLSVSRGSDDWIEFISRGGLLHPTSELLEVTRVLDSEFHCMHGTSLSKEKIC